MKCNLTQFLRGFFFSFLSFFHSFFFVVFCFDFWMTQQYNSTKIKSIAFDYYLKWMWWPLYDSGNWNTNFVFGYAKCFAISKSIWKSKTIGIEQFSVVFFFFVLLAFVCCLCSWFLPNKVIMYIHVNPWNWRWWFWIAAPAHLQRNNNNW